MNQSNQEYIIARLKKLPIVMLHLLFFILYHIKTNKLHRLGKRNLYSKMG
jgi:hypothetical protein